MQSRPWIHAYIPASTEGIVGCDQTLERIEAHLAGYKPGAKALLLHGPTGCGKTAIIYAFARERQLEVVEANASDARTPEQLEAGVGNASRLGSLFAREKLILIDEVDGLAGRQDRGAPGAIVDIIKRSRYPIILTANDPYDRKLKAVRRSANLVGIGPRPLADTTAILERICEEEGITAEPSQLRSIARRSGGDVRAAINDLQLVCADGTFNTEMVEIIAQRDHEESMVDALIRIFKTRDARIARTAFDNVSGDIEEIFLWIDENLPREYTTRDDITRAYAVLAHADRFFARTRRWQYYRFYATCYLLLSAGIALAKHERSPAAPNYQQPQRILKHWIAKQKHKHRDAIAEKLAAATHTSTRTAREQLPYLRHLFAHARDEQVAPIIDELELDTSDVAWLRG